MNTTLRGLAAVITAFVGLCLPACGSLDHSYASRATETPVLSGPHDDNLPPLGGTAATEAFPPGSMEETPRNSTRAPEGRAGDASLSRSSFHAADISRPSSEELRDPANRSVHPPAHEAGELLELDRVRLGKAALEMNLLSTEQEKLKIATQVVEALREGSTVESRLLIGALLGMSGSIRDRNELIAQVYLSVFPLPTTLPQIPQPAVSILMAKPMAFETRAPEKAPRVFRLENVCFADDIRGLGEYTRRKQLTYHADEEAVIYGELVGFRERVLTGDGSDFLYTSRFRGELLLRTTDGSIHELGEFLDEDVSSTSSRQRMNFWSTCRLPKTLQPGALTLVVRVEDLHGHRKVEVELPLEIRN